MTEYRIDVVASYSEDADIPGAFAALPQSHPGVPDLASQAADWVLTTSVRIPLFRQTLTVTYNIEAQAEDADKALERALEIFDEESALFPLPEPETIVANLNGA
jgi:hypothetical protein